MNEGRVKRGGKGVTTPHLSGKEADSGLGEDPALTPTNSLERALLVLDLVGRKPAGLTNAEISRRLHIATSSCSYILYRLEKDQILVRDRRTGRYRIGVKVLSLANGALGNLRIRHIAEPAMHRLAEATNLSACLTILEQGRVVLVEKVTTSESLMSDFEIGTQLPLHATSLGKVLCAHLPEQQVNELIEREGMPKLSRNTIVSRSRLAEELETVRLRGYAVSDEEQTPRVRAVAAPIYAYDGTVVAAISAAGATNQPVWSDPQRVVELVKNAARDISRCVRF